LCPLWHGSVTISTVNDRRSDGSHCYSNELESLLGIDTGAVDGKIKRRKDNKNTKSKKNQRKEGNSEEEGQAKQYTAILMRRKR